MNVVSGLKFLIRSKSFNLLKNKNKKRTGQKDKYNYMGKPILYRVGSSDIEIIYEILLKNGIKSEYWLPSNIEPNIIFDIGGNIGITSIYLARRFPNAKIYTFEPIKENFELLSQNISHYKNIKAFDVALGNEDTEIEMFLSDNSSNFGGGSLYNKGVNIDRTEKVKMKTINTILKEENIDKVDLIKIDTEGAEYDILTSFPEKVLKDVTWIIGELHGINDFKLLDYLESYFDISISKRIDRRLSMFNASNKFFTNKVTKNEKKFL